MEMTWQQWKAMKKDLRRRFSGTGWTLLLYYLIMNGAVILWSVVEMIALLLRQLPKGPPEDMEQLLLSATESGWGYFLAVAVGMLILLLWKKPRYFKEQIFSKGKPMDPGSFFSVLCVFMCGQFLSQMMLTTVELILNGFGWTIVTGMEALSVDTDNFSMFLYAGILAPVAEEILFRGLIQRSLMPFGKRFAILCSAVTFGLFHGNLIQTPFAFLVGLVLGYVASEHNIGWAMVLHMINNLVMADMLPRLTSSLPAETSGLIIWGILFVFSAAALVILIRRSPDIRKWRNSEPIYKVYLNCFFTGWGMILFSAVMLLTMVYTFILLITPI